MDRRDTLLLAATAVGAAAFGVVAGALALQWRSGASRLLSARFVDLAGTAHDLREWRGRVCLVNFWATWCEPCREEVPLLVAAQQQHQSAGLTIVGIGIDSVANIVDFSAKYHLKYVSLVAGPEAMDLVRELGNRAAGLPFSVVLDRGGAVVHRKLGPFAREELMRLLAGILR